MALIAGFVFYFLFFGKGVGQEYNTVNAFLLLIGLVCKIGRASCRERV